MEFLWVSLPLDERSRERGFSGEWVSRAMSLFHYLFVIYLGLWVELGVISIC